MKVAAVLVKHVPAAGAFLRPSDNGLTRERVPHGLDPVNAVAVEWAVQARDAGDLDRVVAVCCGVEEAADSLRRTLAVGVDDVLHVCDPALQGADVRLTARVLAACMARLDPVVAVFGYESLDGSSGTVPAAVAAHLGRPLLSFARAATIEGEAVSVVRDVGDGPERVTAPLPAVISLVGGAVEPRYPQIKELLATRKRTIERVTCADLGVDPTAARSGERVVGLRATPLPKRQTAVVGADAGVEQVLAILGR